MAISKKTRFEVFKRDSFKCQYCGKSPPDVVLEIDHVVPKCSGGDDGKHNLLTACMDCNRGKGGHGLDAIPPSVSEATTKEIERISQMEALNKWLLAARRRSEKAVQQVRSYWGDSMHPDEVGRYVLHERNTPSIRMFLERLPIADLLSSIDIVVSREKTGDDAWKYFCGVCWSKIKQRSATT